MLAWFQAGTRWGQESSACHQVDLFAGAAFGDHSRRARFLTSVCTCSGSRRRRRRGRRDGFVGQTFGYRQIDTSQVRSCATCGADQLASGWRSRAAAAAEGPEPRSPASPCWTACQLPRLSPTSANAMTRRRSKRPGNDATSRGSAGPDAASSSVIVGMRRAERPVTDTAQIGPEPGVPPATAAMRFGRMRMECAARCDPGLMSSRSEATRRTCPPAGPCLCCSSGRHRRLRRRDRRASPFPAA